MSDRVRLDNWILPDEYYSTGRYEAAIEAPLLAARIRRLPVEYEDFVAHKSGEWMLTRDVYYFIFGQEWIVPKGFLTDFASIPTVFQIIYKPWRKDYGPAALLHDYHRRTGVVSKKVADGIFYENMKQCGVGLFTRVAFYRAVRLWRW